MTPQWATVLLSVLALAFSIYSGIRANGKTDRSAHSLRAIPAFAAGKTYGFNMLKNTFVYWKENHS